MKKERNRKEENNLKHRTRITTYKLKKENKNINICYFDPAVSGCLTTVNSRGFGLPSFFVCVCECGGGGSGWRVGVVKKKEDFSQISYRNFKDNRPPTTIVISFTQYTAFG